MTTYLICTGVVALAIGFGFLIGRAGSGLRRRPALGPTHAVHRPTKRGRMSAVECRCAIGRHHWQDGRLLYPTATPGETSWGGTR